MYFYWLLRQHLILVVVQRIQALQDPQVLPAHKEKLGLKGLKGLQVRMDNLVRMVAMAALVIIMLVFLVMQESLVLMALLVLLVLLVPKVPMERPVILESPITDSQERLVISARRDRMELLDKDTKVQQVQQVTRA
jgi:hypothetical protein